MNTDLRKDTKNDFEKDFFKLMNNSVFGKTMENVRNHTDIRIVTTDKRKSILASEPNYHSTKYISKDLLILEMNKVEVKMNKPIYLGQAILDISKTLMYQFWYDYIKPKYGDKARLCYMDTDSFIMHIKTDDFCKDIANDVEKWFDTSHYDEKDKRSLPIGKNKKVISKFKDELVGKIMTEFCALRAKAYSLLIDDYSDEDYEKNKIINKKTKGTKKCIVKREIIFKNYVDAVFNDKILIKSQQRFRSDHHKVYTEEVNKIALSGNDDKRIQTSGRITTYPYGMEIDVDSQNLREESENTRKKSAQINASSQKLGEDLKAIIKESTQIIARSQKLREELRVIRKESAQIIATSQSPKNKSVKVSTQTIFIDEALQYRNEIAKIRDGILKLHSIHQLFLLNDDIYNDTDKEINIDVDKINDDIDKDTDKEINNDVDKINDGNTEEVIDDTIKIKKEINDEINDCTNEEIIDDDTEKVSNDAYVTNEEIIDDDTEETVYIKMLNKMITKVNEFKLAEFTYASCFDEVNEILVKEGNICDDEIYEDPWLKINELYGINK